MEQPEPTTPDKVPPPNPPGDGGEILRPAIPFDERLLSRVQGFTCGETVWAREVAYWIQSPRGTGGALDDKQNLLTDVWIYERADGSLVGFASLGVAQWRYPHPSKSEPRSVLIIPNFAIALAWHGQPPGPKAQRYSRQVLADVLQKATRHSSGLKVIGLVVHPDNAAAIRLYQDFGFAVFGKPRTKDGYLRMVATLPDQ